MKLQNSNALEFAHNVHKEAIDWYKSAETKAQIIIGLTGTVTALISGAIFTKPEDAAAIISHFDEKTWFCFIATVLCTVFGLVASMKCLWSRLADYSPTENPDADYEAKDMFFFGHVAKLDSIKYFQSLKNVDEMKELEIYASQINKLSENVLQKHQWINLSFLSITLGIFFMSLTSVFYLLGNI